MSFSSCPSDSAFGPAVRGCRADFDFTLKFEKIFLSIIPASVFIAISLPRLVYLSGRPSIVKGTALRIFKYFAIGIYAALHLALLGLIAAQPAGMRVLNISTATLTFLSSICILLLSGLEHGRSPRPSLLLSGYLFLTILFDTAQVRTLWLASRTYEEFAITKVTTAALGVKLALVFLEAQPKARWVTLDTKSHSPEELTSLYGLGAFIWLNKLFLAGYGKILHMDDLFPLDSRMAAEVLEKQLNDILHNTKSRGQKYGLIKALARMLAPNLLLPVAPRIAMTGFTFCQPFLINATLSFLELPTASRDPNVGYGLIGATMLTYFGLAVSTALYWYYHERSLWMTRGALASAIYRKTTEAKVSIAGDSAAITLMSTDVEKIRSGMMMIHEFWADCIEVGLASFLLYRSLGVAFLAPAVIVAVVTILSSVIASFTGARQKQWMERIQTRVGMTANVISHMKNLKISGLALPIQFIIQNLRVDELRVGGRFRIVECWMVLLSYVPTFISPVVTFAWTSKTLTVTRMFTSYSYLSLLCTPLVDIFQCVPQVMSAIACLDRIQTFLEADSREDFRSAISAEPPAGKSSGEEKTAMSASQLHGKPVIGVSRGSFGWTDGASKTLSDIDMNIPAGQLTIVVGPIASGKSTFCKALLGEVPIFDGQVTLGRYLRRVGYCDQTPFLTNATIKKNIIGFSSFDKTRYDEVIEAAMLRPDFSTLPQGDETRIGSNGISLSGGQKQRVSIARALYLETNLFIFDDVLSGLDADTDEQVFLRVFGPDGIIKRRNATAVLCTHSVRHLPAADHIIAIGANGRIVEQGHFEDLVANKSYIHSLGVKAGTPDQSSSKSSGISMAYNEETAPEPLLRVNTTITTGPSTTQEDRSRMNGDSAVYKHYYKSIGFWPVALFLLMAVADGFFWNWQSIWINFWSDGITKNPPSHSSGYYLGFFALFQILACAFLFWNVWICQQRMLTASGASLHKAALSTVITAPLKFFTSTDNGVVTNLFSQDMTLMDGELPLALINTSVTAAVSVGMAGVIASSSPYLAITYPFLVAVLWLIQKFYLRTSRQLRLLDLEAKSPLYTHFMDTMKGIASFRAFGWTQDGIEMSNRLLDNSQRPAYLLAMMQRWLGFTLNCVVAVLATLVVTMSTQLSSGTGFTGASLVTLMSFGIMVTVMIRSYTQLETSLGAINRLKTFSETVKSESQPGENVSPNEAWPQNGEIRIEGVSASYNQSTTDHLGEKPSDGELAIRDLNLVIRSGEKVAICGRSGSGKSSTILLLLRLLDPVPLTAENMYIDDVPLHQIDRQILRQRIIAVPQETVFLPDGSSVKENVDPFGSSSELECRSVLETVDLWSFISERGGLEAGMSADTLSQGQKQLFSLARAILRRRLRSRNVVKGGDRGILLLDEISSSVDLDTDRAMQRIIHREFEGYTIVMVSHRLDMVMDFDKVIVMERGSVVETGPPRTLLEKDSSRFKDLWLLSHTDKEI